MMYIEDFSKTFNCCGKQYLTYIEYIQTEYWTKIMAMDKKFKAKSYTNELFGHNVNDNWNNVNTLVYFWSLMVVMYNEQRRLYNQFVLGMIDEEPNALYYRDKYDLECIRKTFACQGIDILPLLGLIGLNYILATSKDGIDYMAVNINSTNHPDFRTFPNI